LSNTLRLNVGHSFVTIGYNQQGVNSKGNSKGSNLLLTVKRETPLGEKHGDQIE
jgi:hypothetical protein